MSFAGFYRVLFRFNEFYWVLPSFTGFLLGFNEFYWVSIRFNMFYWVLPGFNSFQ